MTTVLKSKRFYSFLAVFSLIFFLSSYPLPVFSTIILITALTYPSSFFPLKHYHFWIMISILLIIVPLFTGVQDTQFYIISYSSEQLKLMFIMTLRGISVFLLFQILTIRLNSEKMSAFMTRLGFQNYDMIKKLSEQSLPKIKSILTARYKEFLRRWTEKKSLSLGLSFILDIFTDLILFAEETHRETSSGYPDVVSVAEKYMNAKQTLIIVRGHPGSGKTPYLENLSREFIEKGASVDGVFSRKKELSPEKWQHNTVRISTGEQKQLNTMEAIPSKVQLGKFYFYEAAILWGNEQILDAASASHLIIDEFGILEIKKAGFYPAIKTLSEKFEGLLILSLRPRLAEFFGEFMAENLPQFKNWKRVDIKL